MNQGLKDVADEVRVRLSLARISNSIAEIRSRSGRHDFLTRRLAQVAADAVEHVKADRIGVADLDVAFVNTRPMIADNETEDQHLCRYIASVMQMAREGAAIRSTHDTHPASEITGTIHLHS